MTPAFGPLEPERDVERRSGGFSALGEEPWLHLPVSDLDRLSERFVEITYRASFWDEPVRPVFRFWTRDGRRVDRIAAGPILGAAVWTGRLPAGTQRISVSPTNRCGPFAFVVERVRLRTWTALVVEGWQRQRRPTRSALLTRLIGWKPESDVNLTWAIAAEPLAGYAAWRRDRQRPVDLGGLDQPRFDWSRGPRVRVFITGQPNGEGRAALDRTLASLEAQIFPRWDAIVVDPDSHVSSPEIPPLDLAEVDPPAIDEHAGDVLTTALVAGDRLVPTSLAILAEQAARHPRRRLFYGDAIHAKAGMPAPVFRPGWDRGLTAGTLFGHGCFVRGFDTWAALDQRHFIASGVPPPDILAALGRDDVKPLRRLVLETGRPPIEPVKRDLPQVPPSHARASIIIPTRDHPALLGRMLASIHARTRSDSRDIVVIDNGSTGEEAKALLADLRSRPDLIVLDDRRPFNFSAMCNAGASASSGDILVFLNDDMEVLSEGWLDRLCALALEPFVGAVGAKLTYPDGRLQHVGVLVGMGESAGHFGAPAAADDPGWAGRNSRVHEVSAVTGACLAVERKKFEAVGGFDAIHLPIELSDIDLCLKLNARGWQTIIDPFVHLMHEESLSRGGATLRRLDVYGDQRAIFVERWRHILRDDPAFHPGLSLYSSKPALG